MFLLGSGTCMWSNRVLIQGQMYNVSNYLRETPVGAPELRKLNVFTYFSVPTGGSDRFNPIWQGPPRWDPAARVVAGLWLACGLAGSGPWS